MARYTPESRDRVRDTVDFVDLVSARTGLRRAGQHRYEGLCPFHEERTPSFGIDPVQKVYYCFGCQAAGDVFTFVQETEGVDFKGALELLADRCGVELEREQEDARAAERRRGRERLHELLRRTSVYYERCLWESREAERARTYLRDRGLGEEILREFHVGYAPSAWDRVLAASLRAGFSEAELYATGLAQRSQQNGRPYDRFRGRIMFPLADARGRILGFGARALGFAGQERPGPKYLNTSDNAIYHKGLHLYGADLARAQAARAGASILCEGYTDVIALHQAGLRNAVGLMGTALTAEQVAELARMAPTVLLALDADSSGQEAMLRAAALAAARKLELRVVPLPAGHRSGRARPARRRRGGRARDRGVAAVRALSRRAGARGGRSFQRRGPRSHARRAAARVRDARAERDADGADAAGRRASGAARERDRGAPRRRRARRAARAAARPLRGRPRAKRAPARGSRGARIPSGPSSRCASPRPTPASARSRSSTSTRTSPASCSAAPRGACAGICASRCARATREPPSWKTIRSRRRCSPS